MITLTHLNGTDFVVNADLIERVEGGSDTVVVLGNGHRYLVKTRPEEIVQRVVLYKAEIALAQPGTRAQ
ncbi:MAG: flagellar FlbD family protein [bacterium]